MIISRFKKAYNKQGKPNFPDIKNKSGVYLIANTKNKIVYVGYSGSNLYKTMYRHFQSWDDDKQVRATFPKKGYKVRLVFMSKSKAQKLEKALILKYKPKGNPDKLKGYQLSKTEETIQDDYFNMPITNFDDLNNGNYEM
jgi:excinuclease UvrABC nuclease subunit